MIDIKLNPWYLMARLVNIYLCANKKIMLTRIIGVR